MGPGFVQWYQMTGPEAVGTNWRTGGNTFLLWGWPNTSTCCPERLWSLRPWRSSKVIWTWSLTIAFRRPLLVQGGWRRWPPDVPSYLNHSVLPWMEREGERKSGRMRTSYLIPAVWDINTCFPLKQKYKIYHVEICNFCFAFWVSSQCSS